MSTEVTNVALVNSTVDNTPIGQTTPAVADFVTPSGSDNSQAAATTAWVRNLLANATLSGNGWIKFPNGLLLQWALGTISVNGRGQYSVTWPTPFPNNFFAAVVSVRFDNPVTSANWQGAAFYVQPNSTLITLNLQYDVRSDGSADSTYRPFCVGVGN